MGAILTPAIDAIRKIDEPAADKAHAALLGALAARAAVPRDADFGRYTGEFMDPRTPEPTPEYDDTDPVIASDMAMELAGRADRAWQSGDRAAAADLYREAAQMLLAAAGAPAQAVAGRPARCAVLTLELRP